MKRLTARHFIIGFAVLALFVVTIGVSGGAFGQSKPTKSQTSDVYHDLEIFTKILEKITQNYVDEVDTHQLIEKAIEGMLSELDPHSQYLAGLEYEDLMVSTRGEFGGLGILISFRDNYPTVMSPIDGTPAERAGIRGGDQITEIEGNATEGWSVDKAVGFLRGEPGTKVRFKVSRPGQTDAIEYVLVREVINVSSVPYYSKMDDGIGYIRVSNFAKKTAQELNDALHDLEKQAIRGLVLDFRSNPGGLLQSATEVTEQFLDKDKLLVYTKGRLANANRKYYSSNRDIHKGYPIVVMVNENSASAAEIFAGAMQDWDAAVVVGQTSFGKGTVQTVFTLSETEAVKLTTAKYYTPSGRSIHKDEREHPDEEDLVAMNDGGGEMDLRPDDAPEEKLDAGTTELKEAKDDIEKPVFYTSSGRVVYGGGGITPDIEYTPREYTELMRRLERDGLGFSFAVDYLKNHEITEDFKTTDAILADFYKFLGTKKFEYKKEELTQENVDYIRTMIAREAVNNKFGRKAMYKVVLGADPELQETLKMMEKHPTLKEMFTFAEDQKGVKKAAVTKKP
ncbi:MAG: S41 family peptidase [Candidatus Latescibacteria bacterium]|nr:S41 family peptidase [Candidatus Latescibacterota bacterium]